MSSIKVWTLNSLLAGAQAFALLLQGKETDAREILKNLTSQFEPEDVEYIVRRLKEVQGLME